MIPIRYNLRSLTRRRVTTLATAVGIALVVFVLAAARMLSAGIRETLASSGNEGVAIVLRKGSDSELASVIEQPSIAQIAAVEGVDPGVNGSPAVSAELVVVSGLQRAGGEGLATVTLRGVPEGAFALRSGLSVVEGRMPRPGTSEVAVGQRLRGRFQGLELGGSFELRKGRPVTVVGVFADGGSAYESEVWADLDAVQSAFGRAGLVSAIRVRLAPGTDVGALNARLLADRRLGVEAQQERDYYERQSEGSSAFVEGMGTLMAVFFAAAAILGAMITMNATIASRRREIGTLRALGFGRVSIVLSLVLEACVLALVGGGVGALASLALGFVRIPMLSASSFAEVVFALQPTPGAIAGAMAAALGVGLLGGLVPALRAARIPAITAMRE